MENVAVTCSLGKPSHVRLRDCCLERRNCTLALLLNRQGQDTGDAFVRAFGAECRIRRAAGVGDLKAAVAYRSGASRLVEMQQGLKR